jgi:hypothetical protein
MKHETEGAVNWKTSLDRMAERTNPLLLRIAIALAVLAILMAERRTESQVPPQPIEHGPSWHTD